MPRSTATAYARLLDLAHRASDGETLQALTQVGPPPFKNMKQVASFFERMGKYQPAADAVALNSLKQSLLSPPPDYSLRDDVNRARGFMAVPPWSLYNDLLNTKLTALGPDFDLPVFVIQGADDMVTPAGLTQEFFESIHAPRKEMVTIPNAGHFAVWSHADLFLNELVKHVRPLAR